MIIDERETPGLQAERTRLSWRRTTLSATVVTLLALTTELLDDPAPPAILAAALLWLLLLIVAQRRIVALARGASIPRRIPAGAALIVVAFAILGAILIS